ncbi:hypothetical protein ACSQ67_011327 [Phaseolus vulgaris]
MATLLLVLQLLILLISSSLAQNLQPTDLTALLSIKATLTDLSPSNPFFSTWNLTAPDPCSSFAGLTCTLRRVTALSLGDPSFPLAGTLPASLSLLTDLTQLLLSPDSSPDPSPLTSPTSPTSASSPSPPTASPAPYPPHSPPSAASTPSTLAATNFLAQSPRLSPTCPN